MVTIDGNLTRNTELGGIPLSSFMYNFSPERSVRWERGLIFDTLCKGKQYVFAFIPVNDVAKRYLESSFKNVSISMDIKGRGKYEVDLRFQGIVQVIHYSSFNCYRILEIISNDEAKFLLALEKNASNNLEFEYPQRELGSARFRISLE